MKRVSNKKPNGQKNTDAGVLLVQLRKDLQKLKSYFDDLKTFVESEPNDQILGGKIRNYFNKQ